MLRERITVGQWYLRSDTQEQFQVLDYDERAGSIRVQLFDGSLDEMDEEIWRALGPEPVDPPEDWTGPLDNVEIEGFEEFETEAAADSGEGFEDHPETWEGLLADEEAPDLEDSAESWMSGVVAARDRSYRRIAPHSQA